MMTPRRVVVVVSESHLDRFDQVEKQSALAGLVIENSHPFIGVLQGSIDAAYIPSLLRVDGVKSVEIEHVFQLKPPESDTQ